MPQVSAAATLSKLMSKLLSERQKHLAAIAKLQVKVSAIEAMFTQVGIQLDSPVAKAGKKAAAAGRGRKRRAFGKTGIEMILALVKKHDKPSTAEINAAWKKEGRGGKADNTLSKLTKQGVLKRVKADDARGSRYVLA